MIFTKFPIESLVIASLHNQTQWDLVKASAKRLMDIVVGAEAHLAPSVMPKISVWKNEL